MIPQGKRRDVFDIQKGDSLLVLGDINRGIGIVKADKTAELANMLYAEMGKPWERVERTAHPQEEPPKRVKGTRGARSRERVTENERDRNQKFTQGNFA